MSWETFLKEKSALATALDLVGDHWSLMIVSYCMAGICRFNKMERQLGINRNLLKSRLDRLVNAGVLVKQPIRENSKHYAYLPTEMCMKLRPIMVGLASWGEEYLTKDQTPITYVHRNCEGVLHAKIYCEGCQNHAEPEDVALRLNPGAATTFVEIVGEIA